VSAQIANIDFYEKNRIRPDSEVGSWTS